MFRSQNIREIRQQLCGCLKRKKIEIQTFIKALIILEIGKVYTVYLYSSSPRRIIMGDKSQPQAILSWHTWILTSATKLSYAVHSDKTSATFCLFVLGFKVILTLSVRGGGNGFIFTGMQTGWIQASCRVTRQLAWDPTCLPLRLPFPHQKTSIISRYLIADNI